MEVSIADPVAGAPQPEGVPGELRVRSAMLMKGYFDSRCATADALDAEGASGKVQKFKLRERWIEEQG
jgi:long-subunit acyl-CoA synthetase (AMP-forming)